jgi:polysaccharide export outer membrane protein
LKCKFLLGVLAIFLLAGCTVVPGSRLSYSSDSHWFSDEDKAPALPDLVHVQPINTRILDTQKQQPTQPLSMPPVLDTGETYDYKVGIGDVLQITVWDHPELTIPAGSMRSAADSGNWVHSDGTIFYPYVGKIHVAGLDVMAIRQLISERIGKYIENPQVDVTVAAFKSQQVYVTGAVNKPGMVPISNIPLHLIDAVNAVGGLNEFANWQDVTLVRDGKRYDLSLKAIYQQGELAQNLLLEGGDVINVGRDDDNKVFVLGEVMKPQVLPMGRNGLSLAEALAGAGGLNQMQADASGVFVLRKGEHDGKPGIDLYQLNEKDAAALVLADQFNLQPRDIVYVTSAPIALWNRVISQLLPTVQGLYYGSLAERQIENPDR